MSNHPLAGHEINHDTGSPQSGEPVYVTVGKLRRPHGVKGEMSMDVLTDFPQQLKEGITVFLGKNHQSQKIRSIRYTEKGALIAFDGLMDCDVVGYLRNQYVYARYENRPSLPEGQYYHQEILGMEVLNETGESLGVIDEILETGANDVYVIHSGMKDELLIPAIKSVILNIDRSSKRMVVKLPEWE